MISRDWIGTGYHDVSTGCAGNAVMQAGRTADGRSRVDCYQPWFCEGLVYLDVQENESKHVWFLWDQQHGQLLEAKGLFQFPLCVRMCGMKRELIDRDKLCPIAKVYCGKSMTGFTLRSGFKANVFSVHH